MGRQARIVAARERHHVTQRGNRRDNVFFDDADRPKYLWLARKYCRDYGLDVWAYCLMTNHVHLVAVPRDAQALGLALRDDHTACNSYVNWRQHLVGYLWQGRSISCPLDELHLRAAVRYVERKAVRARLAQRAEQYPWSSAMAHVGGRDEMALLDMGRWRRLAGARGDWRDSLSRGEDDRVLARFRRCTMRKCPMGRDSFIRKLERRLGRRLRPLPIGRPGKDPTDANGGAKQL